MSSTNMTNEQFQQVAPAAFSTSAHPRMTESYSHVTTAAVVDALRQDGWLLQTANQRKARTADGVSSNAHSVALVHPSLPDHVEGKCQLLLGNSGNGTSAVRLMGGFLRSACLNQNYVGLKVVGGVFHHRGSDLQDRIVAGARDLRANFDRVLGVVDLWREIQLDPYQQAEFAMNGASLRWPDTHVVVDPTVVNQPRRPSDLGNDLWSVFSRVQEATIRGGFRADFARVAEDGSTELVTRKVRRVTGISANERINLGLWDLASSTAQSVINPQLVLV